MSAVHVSAMLGLEELQDFREFSTQLQERAPERAHFFRSINITRVATWLCPQDSGSAAMLLFEGKEPVTSLLEVAAVYDRQGQTGQSSEGSEGLGALDDFAWWYLDNLNQLLQGPGSLEDRLAAAATVALMDSSAAQHSWGEAQF